MASALAQSPARAFTAVPSVFAELVDLDRSFAGRPRPVSIP